MSFNETDMQSVDEERDDKFEAFFSLDNPILQAPETKVKDIPALSKTGPGYLESNNQIEIHSKQAYGLLLGNNGSKNRPPRLGLFAFASMTNALIKESRKGNPFSDKLLINLESNLQNLEATLLASKETFKYKKNELAQHGISINPMYSKLPHLVSVKFYSPYSYEMLLRIVDFDLVTRLYLPLRQMRIIDSNEFQEYFNEPRRLFGKCINSISQFKINRFAGITRRSYIEHLNNPDPIIKKAIEQFGSIDEEIILGQRLPTFIQINKSENMTITADSGL